MIVAELIEKLRAMPQDMPVLVLGGYECDTPIGAESADLLDD